MLTAIVSCASTLPSCSILLPSGWVAFAWLQFQLTINLVALIVAFVAAVANGETPLNVLQLLWVNLIMDSLAALGERPAATWPAVSLVQFGLHRQVRVEETYGTAV